MFLPIIELPISTAMAVSRYKLGRHGHRHKMQWLDSLGHEFCTCLDGTVPCRDRQDARTA